MNLPRPSTSTQIEYWLRLLRVKGLSVEDKRALVTNLGSPQAIFDMDVQSAAGILHMDIASVREMLDVDDAVIKSDLDQVMNYEMDYIAFCDLEFPPRLNEISAPPLGLFVRGNKTLLLAPQLAMVGSRNPTPSGIKTAEAFAAKLANAGLVITSGLALGIDSAAHRGALSANGHTIAVVATGLDQVYPRKNMRLNDDICKNGLLVSEFPPGTTPLRSLFPQRNRLISGLSLGTLVVEAGMRSGSLITARTAGEQGREVFAIPGSIHVPTSRGCHFLIRNGAKLVETTQDVLDELQEKFSLTQITDTMKSPEQVEIDGQVFRLYSQIDFTPTSVDQLIEQSGLTADEVSYILMTLEMKGLIAATPSGYQRLPT